MAAYDIAHFDCHGHTVRVRYYLEFGGSTDAEIEDPIDYTALRSEIGAPAGSTDEQIAEHICDVAQDAYRVGAVPVWTWPHTSAE